MIYLENDFVKAGFSTKGAELQLLVNKHNNENYLWEGDVDFWGKFSPVLFPIVGGLKEDSYYFKDSKFNLNRHGFARDKEFTVTNHSENELLLILTNSPETFSIFPFKFQLGIRYTLEDSNLKCNYEVLNTDVNQELLFSIGGHPAFAIHTSNEIQYSDYTLHFNRDEKLIYHEIENDLISNVTTSVQLDQGNLSLSHELFYKDALVFKTLKSDKISLRNSKNSNGIDFNFDQFPFFGIWAAKDADFICLEPWCGIADVVDHNQQLVNKEGIITLEPQQFFERSWNVSLF